MSLTDAELQDLYERYAPLVYRRALAILHDPVDADDVVQETFARVIKHHDRFRQEASPMTWMYRISTNYSLNLIRNRKGRAQKLRHRKQDVVGDGLVPEVEEAFEDHVRIHDLLGQVDEQTRLCVVHTFFDQMTRQQTADVVGLSVPTVRKRIHTFLELARRTLGTPEALATAVCLALFLPLLLQRVLA